MSPLRELLLIFAIAAGAFIVIYQLMERYELPDPWGHVLVVTYSVAVLGAILWHGHRKRPADTQD